LGGFRENMPPRRYFSPQFPTFNFEYKQTKWEMQVFFYDSKPLKFPVLVKFGRKTSFFVSGFVG
jgi:hypothetical protein